MLVVVTRGAQTAPERTLGRITDEAPSNGLGDGKSLTAERYACGSVVIQCLQVPTGEMSALQRLLVLGLVTSPALAVFDGPLEIWMAPRRMTLPTADAHGRMKALRIALVDSRSVARLARVHIRAEAR